MRCSECGFESPGEFRFCGGCGNRMRGATNSAASVATDPAYPTRSDPRAERRQLSVLFCDLVGSTKISEHLDPEELRELVQHYQETAHEAIARFDGSVAQFLGDGILAYFGFPRAHEDDARRAVLAGLAMLEGVRRLAPEWKQRYGFDISVRIGIHTGLVVTGQVGTGARSEQLAVGQTPNLAARLQGLAEPDSIVVSESVYRLTGMAFEFESLGPQELRGVSAPTETFRVLGEAGLQARSSARAQQPERPMVGRLDELARFDRALDVSLQGTPQLLALEGAPGLGKSRLVDAFRSRAESRGFKFWECECAAYHQSTGFFPIICLARDLFSLGRGEIAQDRLESFRAEIENRTDDPDAAGLLADLLNVPLYRERERSLATSKQGLFEVLSQFVEQHAEQQPLVLSVEDAHWIDPSTREWLDYFINRSDRRPAPWLLLVTSRPPFSASWLGRPNAQHLRLGKLGPHDAESLVRAVCENEIHPKLLGDVLDKADGVPIYLEELTKVLLAAGRLGSDTGPLSEKARFEIPTTLHDSLMARLDSAGEAKELAQIGSVLGLGFMKRMLRTLSGYEDEMLELGLARLEREELIQRSDTSEDPRFVFRHALLRDAAYGSLLRSRRDHYHRRAAEMLCREFQEIAEAQPELVAHHFSEAGDVRAAVDAWLRAGERALRYFENQEAMHHLTRGLELLPRYPADTAVRTELELELQLALGSASIAALGYTAVEVGAAYRRALAISVELEARPEGAFLPTIGLWMFHVVRAELGLALPLAERLLVLAESAHSSAMALSAHFARGFTAFFAGDYSRARSSLERAISAGGQRDFEGTSPTRDDHEIHALVFLAWTLYNMGEDARALALTRTAEDLARARGHPYGIVYALNVGGNLDDLCGNFERARARIEEAIAIAGQQGFAYLTATSVFAHASVRASQLEASGSTDSEEIEAVLAQMHHCHQMLRTRNAGMLQTYQLSRIIEHHFTLGRPVPRGYVAALEIALAEGEERAWRCECLRLHAELKLLEPARSDGQQQAERSLRSAVAIARDQKARRFELRAVGRLAELLREQGRKSEARQELAAYARWDLDLPNPEVARVRELARTLA